MGSDIHGIFQAKSGSEWVDVATSYEFNRDYTFFAWVGNVRNGFGFAGVPTHTEIEPLSDNRGLPDGFVIDEEGDHKVSSLDVLSKWQIECLEPGASPAAWMGDHSYSWLSANEILEATPPKIQRVGIVEVDVFNNWDGVSAPSHWCGGISGGSVHICGQSDANEDYIKKFNISHVRVTWNEDTAGRFGEFIIEVKRLVEQDGEIRFVFGFDS